MQQFHSFCPLCNQQNYLKIIESIQITDSQLQSNYLQFVLNPIVFVSKSTFNDLDITYHHYDVCNQAFPIDMDGLYGFDFFLKGCYFFIQTQIPQASQHFELFDKINKFTQPIFKRKIPKYQNFNNDYYNDVCAQLLEILQCCFKKLETINDYNIKELMLDRCLTILQNIENIQLLSDKIKKKNVLNLSFEGRKQLHICQVKYAQLNGNFNPEAFYTKTFNSLNQDDSHLIQIGGILFIKLENSQKLWEIYFQKLNGEQRLYHITSLLQFLSKRYCESYLVRILKLAKGLQKFKEYWLSLVVFSFVRRISIIFQNQYQFNIYLPFLYYHIAKICLYLELFKEAHSFYLQAYRDLNHCNNQIYNDSKNDDNFKFKLQYKIMILSLYLQNSKDATRMMEELLQQEDCLPYHIRTFIEFYCSSNILQLNETHKHRGCKNFLLHLSNVVRKNLKGIQIPTEEIKQLANVIELKDKDIPKCKLNQRIDYQFKQSSYFQNLQFYLILVCNPKSDQIMLKYYYQKQELLEQFLQYSDCNYYQTLSNVIQNFNIEYDIYENLLLCHFYQYTCMFEKCLERLKLFEKSMKENKNKYSKQEIQNFQKLIQNYKLSIQYNHENTIIEQIRPQTDVPQICYSIGVKYLDEGQYQEGLEYLKKASQNIVYKDLCIAYCLKVLQQSREQFSISDHANFNGDLQEIIAKIDFNQLMKIQSRKSYVYQDFQINSNSQEPRRSQSYLVQSLSVSQISRSSSAFYENQTIKQFITFLNDMDINILFERIQMHFEQIPQLDSQNFQNEYPHSTILKENVILYYNQNKRIIMKIKKIIELREEELKKKLKDCLIEILAQVNVNELNEQGFVQLLSLQYQLSISQKYASCLQFYMFFPYYDKLTRLNISQLKELTESINILNSNNIFHRDLKPDNILLNDGHPILIDFDCSYFYDQKLLQCFRGKGFTNEYQPRDDHGKEDKIDIYSLGIIAQQVVDDCPEEFCVGATQDYDDRYSLDQLLRILN